MVYFVCISWQPYRLYIYIYIYVDGASIRKIIMQNVKFTTPTHLLKFLNHIFWSTYQLPSLKKLHQMLWTETCIQVKLFLHFRTLPIGSIPHCITCQKMIIKREENKWEGICAKIRHRGCISTYPFLNMPLFLSSLLSPSPNPLLMSCKASI